MNMFLDLKYGENGVKSVLMVDGIRFLYYSGFDILHRLLRTMRSRTMKIKIIAGLFIFAAVFCLASCGSKENKDNQTEKLKPLTIDISDKRQDGSLTMVDTEGNNYLQFDGIIHIENDGSNGEPIKIVVYQNEAENYEFN